MDENFNNLNDQNSKDDFVIGEGFNLPEESPVKAKVSKDKKKTENITIKSIAWILSIILISVLLAFGIIYAGADFMGIGFGRGENCVMEIEPGTPASQIAEQLEDTGAVKIPLFFRLYAKIKGYDSQFKYGVYTFNNEAGYESISQMLITEGAKAESVTVKIPDGATIDDIALLLVEADVCTKADFIDAVQYGDFDYDFIDSIPSQKVYYRLEGYLYPDTYEFYSYESKECAYLAVDKMLSNLDSKLTENIKTQIRESEYSFNQLMALSSVVQLEAGDTNISDEDRAKVASVFLNRIEGVNWNEPKFLQSDPTTFYPHGNGRYNTYKSEGLPPGPMCAANINCIKAAVFPDRSCKATYFVTDLSMKFYYNETLDGHNKTVAELKKAGNWHYSTLGQ